MATGECTASWDMYKHIRKLVELMKFKGYDIEMMEGTGWFERQFFFKGSNEAIRLLESNFKDWKAQIDNVAQLSRS